MCGRYLFLNPDVILARYGLEQFPLILPSNYNVAPSTEMLTISRDPASSDSGNLGVMRKWGLLPFWAKDPKIGYKMINARAETVAEKASFKKAIGSRRCIVPASGFYEWKREQGRKIPYLFQPKTDTIFSFAGLYETWEKNDLIIYSYTIITTAANDLVQPVHDRMPVILPKDDEDAWLNAKTPFTNVMALLNPFSAADMRCHPVSTEINNVRNNHPDLVKPVSVGE